MASGTPQYSPDGQRLVFASFVGGRHQLYLELVGKFRRRGPVVVEGNWSLRGPSCHSSAVLGRDLGQHATDRAFLDAVLCRWQIELVFKELKQHLSLEVLPSKDRHDVQLFAWASLLALALSCSLSAWLWPLHRTVGMASAIRPQLVTRAMRSTEVGANLIGGHHSHVRQPVERIGKTLVLYGLGNQLFDRAGPAEVVARVELRTEPARFSLRVTNGGPGGGA